MTQPPEPQPEPRTLERGDGISVIWPTPIEPTPQPPKDPS